MVEATYLFKLKGSNNTELDLTNYITVPSYIANNKPICTEWTDGNLRKRKIVHRYKVSGSFTLLFNDVESYDTFKRFYLNLTKYNQYVTASLWIENESQIKENVNLYMDFELRDDMPLMGVKEIDGIEVTIEEV